MPKTYSKIFAVLGGFWHTRFMIIGYARVSTEDQNIEAQQDALIAAGAERIYADKLSGSSRTRPELQRALDTLRQGDVSPLPNTTA